MSDHGDFQEMWSPSQELSTDISYVGSSDFSIISTSLRFEVWDGIISHEDVGWWRYSQSMISKSSAFGWCNICWIIWNFYKFYLFKFLRFEIVYIHMRISDHGDIQSQWSPSQQLSNDVSYLGFSETFLISTWLRVWGLRWYSFTRGCRFIVIFRICDLQVKSFPMMFHILVYTKLL